MMHCWISVCGNTASMAFVKPVRPSTPAMRMSATPRFLKPFKMLHCPEILSALYAALYVLLFRDSFLAYCITSIWCFYSTPSGGLHKGRDGLGKRYQEQSQANQTGVVYCVKCVSAMPTSFQWHLNRGNMAAGREPRSGNIVPEPAKSTSCEKSRYPV